MAFELYGQQEQRLKFGMTHDGHEVGYAEVDTTRKPLLELVTLFVYPAFRNQGFGKNILQELEEWAVNLGFDKILGEVLPEQRTADMYASLYRFYRYAGYQVLPGDPTWVKNCWKQKSSRFAASYAISACYRLLPLRRQFLPE